MNSSGIRSFAANIHARFMRHWIVWICLGVFALVVVLINPVRETAMGDDWAYALTVKHLLDTGHYELSDWSGANMPFQIYWGSLFARVLGYSHSSLRISTLVLAFLGLIAFYHLAREHGLGADQAGMLMLCLLSSPLVLRLSFDFHTDLPFLSCLIVALMLYTRAIRLHSYAVVFLASIAASMAILTRQFGVAVIAGVFSLWILKKECRKEAMFFLTGMALPVIACVWQITAGVLTPNRVAQNIRLAQSTYFADPGLVLTNLLWRPTVILQYLALFCSPLIFPTLLVLGFHGFSNRIRRFFLGALLSAAFSMIILGMGADWLGIGSRAAFGARQTFAITYGMALLLVGLWLIRAWGEMKKERHRDTDSRKGKPSIILFSACTVCLLACLLYGHFAAGRALLMPNIPWGFRELSRMWILTRLILTLFCLLGAVLFALVFILRYDGKGLRELSSKEMLLDLVTLFLLAQCLLFYKMDDRYLIVLLPFSLIAVGRYLGQWLNRFRVSTIIACLVVLLVSAMWTRGLLAKSETIWGAAESVRRTGVDSRQIYGSWEWNCYNGAFAKYLTEIGNKPQRNFNDFFVRWLPEQRQLAQYVITLSRDVPKRGKWIICAKIPYRNIFLQERYVYVMERKNEE